MAGTNRAYRSGRWHRTGDVLLRILVALPIGYGVATLWAMALSVILPMPVSDAVTTGMLVAFVICAVIAMWAFAARSGIMAQQTAVREMTRGGYIK